VRAFVVAAIGVVVLLAVPVATPTPVRTHAVARVVDGDTLVLDTSRRVRLVQIDAPELSGGECYGAAARAALATIVPVGARVALVLDPRLDKVDRYGRTLAYVMKSGTNVNLTLVRKGAASVWFYQGVRGRYATQLVRAARNARAAKRGLWGTCPGTRLDPLHGVDTGTARSSGSGGACDPSYPDACIPPPPPDLDCADIGKKVRVRPPDPHRLDADHDGWGCESYG
jgi:micrococcal nuclease